MNGNYPIRKYEFLLKQNCVFSSSESITDFQEKGIFHWYVRHWIKNQSTKDTSTLIQIFDKCEKLNSILPI